MKKTFTQYLIRYESKYSNEPDYSLRSYKCDDDQHVTVKEVEIEVEFVEGDYIPERVANINEEIRKTYVETEEKIMDLREKKEKLLCITNAIEA
jgi:FMN phosphatase YigB (HAD superfamily)